MTARAWLPRRALFDRLTAAGRVVVVSAPAGSGKTVLLRSWAEQAGVTALMSVEQGRADGQAFWLAVVEALRLTDEGLRRVRGLKTAPGLDPWGLVEHLLEDLGGLEHPMWLIVDDLQEVRDEMTLRQLEVLVMRAPPQLRFLFATREDRLRLHRLRLEGELTELRAADLRFTVAEAAALFETAGLELDEGSVVKLLERSEGWAAGLRLAALSMRDRPDPNSFADNFSGSERTVADYLLAEVLERLPVRVRRVLLFTSLLDRVNGPLADALTGGSDSHGLLVDLDRSGTFVVSVDPERTWFRVHQLLADALRVELRRRHASEIPGLHRIAADWFVSQRQLVEGIRHLQVAGEWDRAARLLSDNWYSFIVDGLAQEELLASFPPEVVRADPELTALAAQSTMHARYDPAVREEVQHQTERAIALSASLPASRRARFELLMASPRMLLAHVRADVDAVRAEAQLVLNHADVPGAAPMDAEHVRSIALFYLGLAERWALRLDESRLHLDRAMLAARAAGQPYLEAIALTGLAKLSIVESPRAGEHYGRAAVEIARDHGWEGITVFPLACAVLGACLVVEGKLDEADYWLGLALRSPDSVGPTAVELYYALGALELARDRPSDALAAFEMADAVGRRMELSRDLSPFMPAPRCLALIRLGMVDTAESDMPPATPLGPSPTARVAKATIAIARDDGGAASRALQPLLDGSIPPDHRVQAVEANVLQALAHQMMGDSVSGRRAFEHAAGLAEAECIVLPFLLHEQALQLERSPTQEVRHLKVVPDLAKSGVGERSVRRSPPGRTAEPLTESELRVLRLLPTHLSAPDIAGELYLSVTTVRTHMQRLYTKLDAHSRTEAVERARVCGLLAPESRVS